jgi:hypothetical protein
MQAGTEFPTTVLEDAYAIEEAIDDLDRTGPDHFCKIKASKLANMAGLCAHWLRFHAALIVLNDQGRIQSVVTENDGRPAHVFLRTGTDVHENTCAPMYACDVEAICAMVGGKGLAELEAIPRSRLTDLRRHGCKHNTAMQTCLRRVLAKYTEAGAVLIDDPRAIDEFVETAVRQREGRLADIERLEHEALTAVPATEPTEETEMEAEMETEEAETEHDDNDDALCPRCTEGQLSNGTQVCEPCVTELLQMEQDSGPERAVAADRRSGGQVLVGGMLFDPERIRRLLGRAVRITREVQNTMLPPLTDELEEDEEPLNGRDRGRLLHQVDARVSDLRSILSSLRVEFVEDQDHASRLSQFGRR